MDLSASRTKITYFSLCFVAPLLICSIVYALFRSPHTVLYQVITTLLNPESINKLRALINHQILLPDWIIYNAPGGLWLFAFCFLVSQLNWSKNLKYFLITLLFITVCSIEFSQLWQLTDGVFDPLDLLSYGIAVLLILARRKRNFENYYPAKNRLTNQLQLSLLLILFSCTIYLSDQL